MVVQPNQTDWVEKLPMDEFAINSNLSSSTSFTPFKLNYGYMPTILGGIAPMESSKPGVRDFFNKANGNLIEAHDVITESHQSGTLCQLLTKGRTPIQERG